METLYKLTDQSARTKNDYTWGEGVTLHADPDLPADLCSAGVIHAYRSPLVALFMNPIHADIKEPALWEAQGEVCADDGTKVGCRALTTVRRMEYTAPTTTQRVAFGILASLEVYKEPRYKAWADGWLRGDDRSKEAAEAAWAEAAAWAAAWASSGVVAAAHLSERSGNHLRRAIGRISRTVEMASRVENSLSSTTPLLPICAIATRARQWERAASDSCFASLSRICQCRTASATHFGSSPCGSPRM